MMSFQMWPQTSSSQAARKNVNPATSTFLPVTAPHLGASNASLFIKSRRTKLSRSISLSDTLTGRSCARRTSAYRWARVPLCGCGGRYGTTSAGSVAWWSGDDAGREADEEGKSRVAAVTGMLGTSQCSFWR